MKNHLALRLFLSLAVTGCPGVTIAAAAPGHKSLCHARETTYFSCGTARHKTISLCGALPSNLQYRYGSATRLELEFPKLASDGPGRFRYAHYARFQTDRAEVSFHHADTDYAVFDYNENGRRSAGVQVTTANGKELQVRCAGAIRGNLDGLGQILQCDTDSALNLGGCR